MPKGIYKRKNWVEKTCPTCKKEFEVKPSHRGIITCCSLKCRNVNIKGRTPWNKGLKGYMAGKNHPYFGKKRSKETCEKIRKTMLRTGQQPPIHSRFKKNDPRLKLYLGKNHPNYKGGISIGKNKMDYIVALTRKRRIQKRGNGGTHELSDWNKLKEKYNFTCLACGKNEPEIRLTEDHIIPLSLKGTHDIKNIQPLCRKCNAKKSIKIIDYRKIYEQTK